MVDELLVAGVPRQVVAPGVEDVLDNKIAASSHPVVQSCRGRQGPAVRLWQRGFVVCIVLVRYSHYVTGCHMLSYVVMGCHGLSWVVMGCHGLSWVVMCCHELSCVVMCCHGLSWVVICCHVLRCACCGLRCLFVFSVCV